MPKSVLQDWVMELPLREQGTLLTGIRGCDETPKYPLDSVERRLVAFIRQSIMNPADPREVDYQHGCFFSMIFPDDVKPSAFGHYPLHWVMHIVHVLEVIGYRHPSEWTRVRCAGLYVRFCQSFHMNEETFEQMRDRLSEDRIAKGDVVS